MVGGRRRAICLVGQEDDRQQRVLADEPGRLVLQGLHHALHVQLIARAVDPLRPDALQRLPHVDAVGEVVRAAALLDPRIGDRKRLEVAVVEAPALPLVDRAELPVEDELEQALAAARGADRTRAVGGRDGDPVVRPDLLVLEHVDERPETLRERALLAAHRPGVVDDEENVDGSPQLQLDLADAGVGVAEDPGGRAALSANRRLRLPLWVGLGRRAFAEAVAVGSRRLPDFEPRASARARDQQRRYREPPDHGR